jgi:hypothetical protein
MFTGGMATGRSKCLQEEWRQEDRNVYRRNGDRKDSGDMWKLERMDGVERCKVSETVEGQFWQVERLLYRKEYKQLVRRQKVRKLLIDGKATWMKNSVNRPWNATRRKDNKKLEMGSGRKLSTDETATGRAVLKGGTETGSAMLTDEMGLEGQCRKVERRPAGKYRQM